MSYWEKGKQTRKKKQQKKNLMCVTEHLIATIRTVQHLKFLSRIMKQKRFCIIIAMIFFSCFALFYLLLMQFFVVVISRDVLYNIWFWYLRIASIKKRRKRWEKNTKKKTTRSDCSRSLMNWTENVSINSDEKYWRVI